MYKIDRLFRFHFIIKNMSIVNIPDDTKISTSFTDLQQIEKDIDKYRNQKALYIPITYSHMYGRKIQEYTPTPSNTEQWYRICLKYMWFTNCPVNHDDGLWETFN